MKYNTVLFDLDGTLIDTNELIIASFLYTLDQYYPGKYRREDILPHMGKPLGEQMALFDPENVPTLVETYREHNYRVHDEMVREFPHVLEAVKDLDAHGIVMGIVTTKQIRTTLMGLQKFGLEPYMKTIVAYGDTKEHKPHPAPVLLAMEKLQCAPAKTLMVGDSTYDIEAAHRAGIHAAGVKWSLKPLEVLLSVNPEYMLDDMRDLRSTIGIG